MATDDLAAALDEIRERHALIDEPCGDLAIVVGRFKHSTDDIPRLLTALDEVLKVHQPLIRPSFKPKCGTCTDEQGYRALWPCPEYEAITRALLMPIRSAG